MPSHPNKRHDVYIQGNPSARKHFWYRRAAIFKQPLSLTFSFLAVQVIHVEGCLAGLARSILVSLILQSKVHVLYIALVVSLRILKDPKKLISKLFCVFDFVE